jgi:predicted protein tyrosine phosphatase
LLGNHDGLRSIEYGQQARSPTAEVVFQGNGIEATSAGLDANATRIIDEKMIQASDVIFVMEQAHRKAQKALQGHPRQPPRHLSSAFPTNTNAISRS